MAKFQLSAKVTVSAFTEVHADTLEDAIRIATSRHVALEGDGSLPGESWIIEEADGSAKDITEA